MTWTFVLQLIVLAVVATFLAAVLVSIFKRPGETGPAGIPGPAGPPGPMGLPCLGSCCRGGPQ